MIFARCAFLQIHAPQDGILPELSLDCQQGFLYAPFPFQSVLFLFPFCLPNRVISEQIKLLISGVFSDTDVSGMT